MQNCKSILEGKKKKPLFNYKKELHLYNVLSQHEETYIKLMNSINSSGIGGPWMSHVPKT